MVKRLRDFFTPVRVLESVVVLMVIFVTVWTMHPSLIFSTTTVTGGDTGAHLALPAFLKSQGSLLHLTPWYPGWFNGMPAYTYYFVLPDYFAVLASYVINFAIAFKLVTILGSVLMPFAAFIMAKLFRAPRPVPAALAVATLPFLFDASFTIDGGNLFSTMAGEYAFSLSLALSLLTIGFFAQGVRTGRGYWKAATALSATMASHVLPWFFCVAAIAVLVIFELLARRGLGAKEEDAIVLGDFARPVRFSFWAGLLSLLISAWWLVPFLTSQAYTNSMGYVNDNVSSLHEIFSHLGWFTSTGAPAGDRWVIIVAAIAFVASFIVRDRLGMILSTLAGVSLLGFIFDPQSVIWNERIVPFWFLTIHLSAGWLLGYLLSKWINRKPKLRISSDISEEEIEELEIDHFDYEQERTIRKTLNATLLVALLGLGTTLPGLIAPVASALHLNISGNQVGVWAQWNYSGYQAKSGWNEYQDIMSTMKSVSAEHGCGNAMWEYASGEDRFGTPEALMLLPYWTNNCVGSMEGLFFESSATTPYHFINQSELSVAPSDAQVGLNYGSVNVALGVQHLQMLGVKYYMAFSPTIIAQASANPSLKLVATTKSWPSPGVKWSIYLIKDSPVVEPLTTPPVVVSNVSGRTQWLGASQQWYNTPLLWRQLIASNGPSNWSRVKSMSSLPAVFHGPSLASTTVSHVVQTSQSISFHVSKIGTPVLVKISYFPRWHAIGATGPYRVSPNEMVVIPTSHNVSLVYGQRTELGAVLTGITIFTGLFSAFIRSRWRRKSSK